MPAIHARRRLAAGANAGATQMSAPAVRIRLIPRRQQNTATPAEPQQEQTIGA